VHPIPELIEDQKTRLFHSDLDASLPHELEYS
jgi:hypothetical protein